ATLPPGVRPRPPGSVNTRFRVDLLHPGAVAPTWQDWFTGLHGRRRLALATVGALALLLLVLLAGLLPTYWRLAGDLAAVPGFRRALAARDADLGLLRSTLSALSREAARRVGWADLLTALSRETPGALKPQLVDASRTPAPAAPGPPAAAAKVDDTLRIEALTPLRPGNLPLLEVAQFMSALMRDPAVSRRFELKSWEISPAAAVTAE